MNPAPASWSALQPHFDTHGAVQVRDLPAAPGLTGSPQVSILLLRTQDEQTLLAVPEALAPPDGSPLQAAVAQAPVQDGWRLLSLIPGTDLQAAWDDYRRLFVTAEDWVPPSCERAPARDAIADDSRVLERAPTNDTPSPTPPFCADLLAAARNGHLPRAIGRDTQVSQLIEALGGKIKRSACLVGEPGVGKTAVVEELAHRMAAGEVPPHLQGAGLWQLDLSQFIGGAAQHGDVEQRVGQLAQALLSPTPQNPLPLLFIDELHATTGARGDLTLAELLKPHLARGLRVIGATTHADWAASIEPDRALVRRFQRISIPPPDRKTTLAILQARLPELQAHHNLTVPETLLSSLVDLSDQWLWGRTQPDKALELLDAAMSHQAATCLRAGLTEDALTEALARMVGLDPADLRRAADPKAFLQAVEDTLADRIIGQAQTLPPLLTALRSRLLCGLQDRPTLCLLLAGPSGVGKTETAVQLAKAYAGTEDALVRIDGSEFSEPHTVARLIGSPPGYIGFGEGGLLTEALKRRPRCVVLFDEVEKAAPTVHHLLLQVMSAGRLTDGSGETMDCRHACIILTSNLGNRSAQPGDDASACAVAVLQAVRAALPVELLGRLDAIVPFRRLSAGDLVRIVDLRLADLAQRLPGIATLTADGSARAWLAQRGWSPDYGARELERVIRAEVEPLLAEALWDQNKGADPIAARLALTDDGQRLALELVEQGGETDGP